jgi:holo-[acyl-carrier protein] synthase
MAGAPGHDGASWRQVETEEGAGMRPHVVVGVDMLERARVLRTYQRFGERFLRRVFTQLELDQASWRPERLVSRFVAKEACAKALGTGIGMVAWHEIEILRLPGGKPSLHLHGRAAGQAALLGLTAFDVSISDTATHTVAVVVGAGSL